MKEGWAVLPMAMSRQRFEEFCLPWPRPWLVGQRYNDKVGDDLAGEARTGVETADGRREPCEEIENRKRWQESLYKWRLRSRAG